MAINTCFAGIIGANGQDGFLMTKFLLNKKKRVVAIVRSKNKLLTNLKKIYKKKLEIIVIEKFENRSFENVLKKYSFNKIFFFAGYSKIPTNRIEKQICKDSNYKIFEIFLKSCLNLQIKSKILYLSSSEVFGSNQTTMKYEESKLVGSNCYSKCKIKSLKLINKFRKKYNLYISNAICYNHESRFTPKNHLIRKIIKKFKNRKKNIIIYNPDEKRNISHADDFLPFFLKVLNLRRSDNYIFANNQNISVKNIVEYYNKIFNKKIIFKSKKHNLSRMANNKKLISRLNYKPKFNSNKVLDTMLYYDNKKLFYK